jgi:parvulin-like peptidyl-prolyl isomerase
MSNKNMLHRRLAIVMSAVLALPASLQAQASKPMGDAPFAIVNQQPISQQALQAAYASHLRQAYFHKQVSHDELAAALRLVKEQLIDRQLLLEEARRRGLKADEKSISRTLDELESRYSKNPQWQENRLSLNEQIRQQLTENSLLEQLEASVRKLPEPGDVLLLEYYAAHPDLFTEPEKYKLSTILLRVEPSAAKSVWDAARSEAQRILKNLHAGARFEELARLHSSDASAQQNGDMGYLHRGMIPDSVMHSLENTPLASLTPPVEVLEGIAIFKLDARMAPKLLPFESVRSRAISLYMREKSQAAWGQFRQQLRQNADIRLTDAAQSIQPVSIQ